MPAPTNNLVQNNPNKSYFYSQNQQGGTTTPAVAYKTPTSAGGYTSQGYQYPQTKLTTTPPPTQIPAFISSTAPRNFSQTSIPQGPTQPQTPQEQQNIYTPNRGLFPNVAQSIAGLSSAPLAGYNQGIERGLGASNSLNYAVPSQNQNVQQATENLQNLQNQYAQQQGIIGNSPIGLSAQGGEQGLLNTQYANKLSAAQTALQNALQSNQQEQSAYLGAGQLANQAAGVATGQQQVQQQGLLGAGGLTQPQQVSPTNIPFNPAEGTYGNPASSAYGTGGLQAAGNAVGQVNVGQNIAQLNSALGGAQVVGENLQNLISQQNINPTGLTYANGLLQFGARAMSDPSYQKFAGQINDFVASLAPILGVGGNVTDMKTQMSAQIVNALQSGRTINDVVSYFLDQAKQKVLGLQAGGGVGNQSDSTNTQQGGTTFGSFFGT